MEIIRHIKVDLYGDTQHFAVAAKQMDMGTRYIGVTLMRTVSCMRYRTMWRSLST